MVIRHHAVHLSHIPGVLTSIEQPEMPKLSLLHSLSVLEFRGCPSTRRETPERNMSLYKGSSKQLFPVASNSWYRSNVRLTKAKASEIHKHHILGYLFHKGPHFLLQESKLRLASDTGESHLVVKCYCRHREGQEQDKSTSDINRNRGSIIFQNGLERA
ncbi:DNA-directed RNA polymerase subunit beta [Striga asiatica]|uniref:DNA-directed RNA polymerase subunit beta n=1 Tax=Striga asiatica TaxID=4170 RepID=A0A5A7RIA9_STRAF|nr:DNA-directed RNA polymerase subunit beta [Striga asiatica]